jgi:hypothetical protein
VSIRKIIFSILVLAVTALFFVSWYMPSWWGAYAVGIESDAVRVHPYVLEVLMPAEYASSWLHGADEAMPAWFTPFMWIYFGLCLAAIYFGIFLKEPKRITVGKFNIALSQLLIGVVGISIVVVAIACAGVISINLGQFYGPPLVGETRLAFGEYSSIVLTSFRAGYWMACAAGILLILLALLRNKIIGNN